MLERPNITDEAIAAGMLGLYGLAVNDVTFLPIGYDVQSSAFKLQAQDGKSYFLKLRSGNFIPITVKVPELLSSLGINGIIPILKTRSGASWGKLESHITILYPFIPGHSGYQAGLSDQQWELLGQLFRSIHTVMMPADLAKHIPHETYSPQWRQAARRFLDLAAHQGFTDPIASSLADFLAGKREVIVTMITQADELASTLQHRPMKFVLCHADAHPGNYHLTDSGQLYLVDWDNAQFAPREHDLMCIGAGMMGDQPGGRQELLFYRGYGDVEIDHSALAYYRYERIIQDIAEFCKQILLSSEGGCDRQQSLEYLISSFSPSREVEVAFHTDKMVIPKEKPTGV